MRGVFADAFGLIAGCTGVYCAGPKDCEVFEEVQRAHFIFAAEQSRFDVREHELVEYFDERFLARLPNGDAE